MIYTKFLTNAPATKMLRDGEWEELHILTYALPAASLRGVLEISPSGAGTTTRHVTSALTVVGNRLTFCVKVPGSVTFGGIARINAFLESKYVSNGVDVWERCTEIRSFIPDKTTRKKVYRIGFVNLLGGVDYYTFYGTETKIGESNQSSAQRELPYPFAKSDRGEKVVSTKYLENVEIFSEFISETEATWLSEILSSPEVWRVSTVNNIPIRVTTQNVPIVSEALMQLQFQFRDANQRITQNG